MKVQQSRPAGHPRAAIRPKTACELPKSLLKQSYVGIPYFGNTMKYTDFSGIQCILRYVTYNGYVII